MAVLFHISMADTYHAFIIWQPFFLGSLCLDIPHLSSCPMLARCDNVVPVNTVKKQWQWKVALLAQSHRVSTEAGIAPKRPVLWMRALHHQYTSSQSESSCKCYFSNMFCKLCLHWLIESCTSLGREGGKVHHRNSPTDNSLPSGSAAFPSLMAQMRIKNVIECHSRDLSGR